MYNILVDSKNAVVNAIKPVTNTIGSLGSIFRPDTANNKVDSVARKAAEEAKKKAAAIFSERSASDALQQLFSKTSLTTKEIHQFRNQRHQEFLEHNPYAVRLRSYANGETVAFRVSPEINESRNVAYRQIDMLHMPGTIPIFQNTAPRTWAVSAIKLASRNGVEADENLSIINQLRTWQLPFFGKTSTLGKDGFNVELLGAPPEILEFTAYSNASDDTITNIRKIPVVITSLTFPYHSDVDYIKTAQTNQPFPSFMTVDIQLLEVHSPREFSNFDLLSYKQGKLTGF